MFKQYFKQAIHALRESSYKRGFYLGYDAVGGHDLGCRVAIPNQAGRL